MTDDLKPTPAIAAAFDAAYLNFEAACYRAALHAHGLPVPVARVGPDRVFRTARATTRYLVPGCYPTGVDPDVDPATTTCSVVVAGEVVDSFEVDDIADAMRQFERYAAPVGDDGRVRVAVVPGSFAADLLAGPAATDAELLAAWYHFTCESYDRSVCILPGERSFRPGPEGNAVPSSARERSLCHEHAARTMRVLLAAASRLGVEEAVARRAVRRHSPRVAFEHLAVIVGELPARVRAAIDEAQLADRA